jgi:predicted ATP-grasp superfamily ATP-dependent carboligase
VGRHTFKYRALAPLRSLAAAIAAANPDLIVSGDDLATWHLHRLYRRNLQAGSSGSELIERSLGTAEYFPVVEDRASFMQLSQQAGVRVPPHADVASSDNLKDWLAKSGFPTVLKANGTSGGEGVRVVHNADEARRAVDNLQAPPLLARATKRALLDRDATLVWPSLLRHKSAVIAQSFIAGREATSALACWKGTVLASLHFEVLQKNHSSGHATVIRRIDHPEMAATAETIVRRLQLSGLQGFDFMLDVQTSAAYLIEINPRATQVCHLNLGPGSDLLGALVSALTGSPVQSTPRITQNDVIALFPQEWLRNPSSPYLISGFHDVPWEEPDFLRTCLHKPSQISAKWVLAKKHESPRT